MSPEPFCIMGTEIRKRCWKWSGCPPQHCASSSTNRYSVYRSLKSLLQPEKYLTAVSIAKFRHVLVKFRLGTCEININNRYNEASKLCHCCKTLENEIHFLFDCPMYKDLRAKYWSNHFSYPVRSQQSFQNLLQSDRVTTLRDLAMFIYYALKEREAIVNTWLSFSFLFFQPRCTATMSTFLLVSLFYFFCADSAR